MSSMAMSDTGSSLAQWDNEMYYHHNEASLGPSIARVDGGGGGGAVDTAVMISNGGGAVASPTSAGSGGSPARSHLGVEGARIGKPARRRSRASRRAPVTLLNTDTSNFRAMVQQFTGIPASAGGYAGQAGVPVINFSGSDYGFPAPAAVMPFDHLHQRQPASFQHQLLRQQQQQYTGATFGYSSLQSGAVAGVNSSHSGDVFAHALSSAEDRMLLQSMQAAQMPSSAANHSANGFFA